MGNSYFLTVQTSDSIQAKSGFSSSVIDINLNPKLFLKGALG